MNRPKREDYFNGIGHTFKNFDICGYSIDLEAYCDELENKVDKLKVYAPSRDKEFIDQLHYVHEHVYACQGDYYSNGGHINLYTLEKLDTAMRILQNTLNHVRKVLEGVQE